MSVGAVFNPCNDMDSIETVIETTDGLVVSGRRTMRACKQRGLNCPRIIVHCDRGEAQRLRSAMLNKSLTRKRLILWLKNRPKVHVKTERQAETVKKQLKELGSDAPSKEMLRHHLTRAVREVRRARIPTQPPLKGHIQIEHCDLRQLALAPKSVDLFLLDPPYSEVDLYVEAAQIAAEALKDGRLFVCYCGTEHLDEVIVRMHGILSYVHKIVLLNDNCSQPDFQSGFFHGHMDLLVYSKGKPTWYRSGRADRNGRYFRDVIVRGKKDKSLHPWQQPVDEAVKVIEGFTQPGELVVDLFGGSFTTAVACKMTGRHFKGCDNDKSCVNLGRKRISDVSFCTHR
jgi:DNA methylase